MSTEAEKPSADEAGERHYFFICLAALLVLQLVLLSRPLPGWLLRARSWLPLVGLWPVLLGGLGLMLRWRLTPLLVLLAVSVLLFLLPSRRADAQDRAREAYDPVRNMLLGAAALTFVVAGYRLQSLQHAVFPRDPRQRALADKLLAASRRKREEKGVPAPVTLPARRRPGRLVSMEELSFLLLTVVLWVGLAPFCFPLFEAGWPEGYERHWWGEIGNETGRGLASGLEGMVEMIWQLSGGFWLLGGGVLLASLLLNHLLFRRQSPEEAALFLQDTVWKETRREQRRENRWLAWVRLRREKRKELS